MIRNYLPLTFVIAALATNGCGGGSNASSSTAGATATGSGTVATSTTPTSTTARAAGSFNVRFSRLQNQLSTGLKKIESGDLADVVVGSGAVLSNCTDTVSSELGSRARTPAQQQSVSHLRTACNDVALALAKLKAGDTAAAKRLARVAQQEVEEANRASG